MNIFEYLGLPANHRAEDKITHKVKNYHEIPDAKKKWPAIAQVKEDGVHALCVLTKNNAAIFSRTGKEFVNCYELLRELSMLTCSNHNLVDVVISAELCNSLLSLEELSGAVNPNRVYPLDSNISDALGKTRLVAFDMISVEEFIKGKSELSYFERHRRMMAEFENHSSAKVHPVLSFSAKNEDEFLKSAKELIDSEAEGAVLKQDFIWQAGKKDHCMAKIVRGVDFDLEVVGLEEGKGKRQGMVANLIVRWREYGESDGKIILLPVDGRFTDEQRVRWWCNEDKIIGKVVHVHALQLGSKGSLRLAKVHSVRIDKDVADL